MEKSKVKLLPHVLIRLGGMSYDVLKDLEFSENILEQIETFEKLEQQFIQNQIDLIEYLKEYSMDYIHFSLIRKLKKVIRKGQLVKVTLFEVLSEVLINKVLIYNNLLSNRITNKVALEYSFEVRYLKIQEQLQIISQNDNLQKALPLSSLTFSKQYLKYLDKTPKQFRKKEQQIQQKLMQFLTRTATKASPFSSFTPVCYGTLGQLNDNRFFDTTSINLNLKRQIEWNNYLLEIFKSAFINHDDILPFFKVYLNATIKSNEFEYEFLINQQNIEKFQKLEKQPILEIFETMVSSDNGIQIKVLIDQLRVEIEAEESDLLTFLRELINIGFLEIRFSFNQKSTIWLNELMDLSKDIPFLKENGWTVFQQMQLDLNDFETADINKRIEILEHSFGEIQQFLNSLKSGVIDTKLKTKISPEQLIYEDTMYQGLMKVDATKTQILVEQLNELLSTINFIKGKERLQIQYFFDHNYKEKEMISVLDFYENFYKNGKRQLENEKIESIESEGLLITNWVKAIEALLFEKYQETTKVELTLVDFQKINERFNIKPKFLKGTSFCCFAHLFESNEKPFGVLNALSLGFGKMTGRFLDLMPNEFYQTLKQLNSIENEKILKVENTDAAFFNANNHPLLLDFELVINKSLKKERIKKQLLMSDLFIRKRDNELIIWHKKLNKQVQIFDLGIQTPKGRSPLYQFLQNFSTPIPSLYYLELAIERFEKQLNLKNQFSPSIVFEDWILKRNTWKIPNLGKMEQIGSFSNLKLYQNWLNWRLKNNFLQKDYFIKSTKNTDNQLFKNRKPTYISFNNLMLQHNSFYQKEKEVEPLQIQGMKPDETELLKISEQKYISEFVLQWYNI